MHADTITTWSGLLPTPHQCVSAQCGFRFSSASPRRFARYARSSTSASGITSRMLSVIPVLFFGDESPDSPQTRSKALRRTKRVLDARQGMEGAKNAYRGSEVKRADTLTRGFQVARTAPAPAKPICTEQAAMRLVGGRRPSVLQRWGSGFSPLDGFR